MSSNAAKNFVFSRAENHLRNMEKIHAVRMKMNTDTPSVLLFIATPFVCLIPHHITGTTFFLGSRLKRFPATTLAR